MVDKGGGKNDMEIILYLSVALIAIAFLVLVIYLSKTLKSLQEHFQVFQKH